MGCTIWGILCYPLILNLFHNVSSKYYILGYSLSQLEKPR
jgi:hypothetical protein